MTSPPKMDPDTALTIYAAAVVGPDELAVQLERLGISDSPEDALEDAHLLRKDLLEEVERLRRGG